MIHQFITWAAVFTSSPFWPDITVMDTICLLFGLHIYLFLLIVGLCHNKRQYYMSNCV